MLLGIASKNNLVLGQLDVKTAFLNGILKEEIYMELPKGYPTKPVGVVCKLIKSLYGFKQSPMKWNSSLDQYLLSIGFKLTAADPCLYFRTIKKKFVLLAVYVDDIVVAASTKAIENAVKKELKSKFEITDLGELNWYLGMKVTRNPKTGTIYLDRSQYIQKVLEKFSMTEAKPAHTPMSSAPDATEIREPRNQTLGSSQTNPSMPRLSCRRHEDEPRHRSHGRFGEPGRLGHGRLRLRALVEPTVVFKSALNHTDSFTNSTTFTLQ